MVSLQTALSSKAKIAGGSGGAFDGPRPAVVSPPVVADSSRKRKREARGGCVGREEREFLISTAAGTRNEVAKEVGGGGSFLELLMCPNKSRRAAVAEEDKGGEEETSRVPQQMLDVELHLGDRPMPVEWQRCLDIQSGRIHFLNSPTPRRTSNGQGRGPPSPPKSIGLDAPAPAGIDLELNLSCDSSSSSASSQRGEDFNVDQHSIKNENKIKAYTNKSSTAGSTAETAAAPESSFDEMVAAVCARCHMLIMMRRTSPSCPNCKFLHPQPSEHQQQQGFGGRSLVRPAAGFSRLLCCKD